MRRECFHVSIEGEWLQIEHWWFLVRDSGGERYVIHERYMGHATRKGPDDVTMEAMAVETALARQDLVAKKLRAAVTAEGEE